MTLNKNIKLILNYGAGPILMLILLYTISKQLQHQPNWKGSLQQIKEALTGTQQWKLYTMIVLMGVNWALEAAKWRLSIQPIQQVSFLRACKAILAGACIASFTPNRVGEYAGRMLFVNPGKKISTIAPTIVCSMAQMLITILAGTLGLFLFSRCGLPFPSNWPSTAYFNLIMIIVLLGGIFLSTLYFRFDPLVRRVNLVLEKYHKTISIPDIFSRQTLGKILSISLIRYLVFLIQYFLLFSLFGLGLPAIQVFMGVSVMFVVMAVIPTLTLFTDLGFRWEAGMQIFRIFTTNTAGILAVSLGIWLINLIIPALIGSLLILRIKLFSSR